MKYISTTILFLVAINGFGQNYFTLENQNIPLGATSINSMDVESADIDNDGDLDLIIAGEYTRNLLFFNDGSGVFTEDPTRLFPEKNTNDGFAGEDSEDIALADFDLDGDLDILFVSEDTDFHELLTNDGTGLFTFVDFDFQTSNGNAVAVLDLNNDNYPDIIIGNTGQNHVYINDHDLTFTLENNRWPVNTEGTQDLKLIDLDNDGDLDIIEGIDLGTNNILINNGGFFTEENNRLPATGLTLETRKISLGDINNDGAPDIFVSTVNFIGTANFQNRMYLNDGTGFFTDVTNTQLPEYAANTLDAVFYDYDMDGDVDLITTDFQNNAGNYHVFDNDGLGNFNENNDSTIESFYFYQGVSLYLADFNNDGYDDLYFGNFQENDALLFYNSNALSIQSNSVLNEWVVYPNPFSSQLNLQLTTQNYIPNVKIHLLNSLGQKTTNLFNGYVSPGQNKFSFDVSDYNTGVYFIQININNEKIIKQLMLINE